MAPPRVFISYAWGDEDAWVEEFATRLRADGVDARLDRWELYPGEEIATFMEEQIRESAFVLFICTPKFKAKADERKGGVGYEAMIATAEVMAKRDEVARKYIPVHRSGAWANAGPSWLLGKYTIGLAGDPYPETAYQDLLDTLHARRRGPPPLGRASGSRSVTAAPRPASPPVVGPGPRAALERLLLALFSDSELRRFVTYLPDGPELSRELPSGGSAAEYAHALVTALQARGMVDDAFFDALVAKRPRREHDIVVVRRGWLG